MVWSRRGDKLIVVYPQLYRKLSDQPQRDFVPVVRLASAQFVLSVDPMVPAEVRTLADFSAWRRANPQQAAYGSSGAGSVPHFTDVELGMVAGRGWTRVAYKGAVPALNDLLGGQVAANVDVISGALPHIRASGPAVSRRKTEDNHPMLTSETPDTLAPSTPLLVIEAGVATITLNRPAHRNRLEDADLHTLLRYCEQINADASVRVVVLTANTEAQPRPVFCAGYHIGGFDGEEHDPQLFQKIPDALAALRPITVCALNGSVYGGATDLVLACDLRVALEGIEFRMPATALGLHYYPSGLQRYVTRLGVSGAMRAFLTARPFSAVQLAQLGCLEELAAADRFDAAVRELVGDVAALAPLAVQATKQSLNEIALGQFDLPALRAREALTAGSRDFAEGRQAFAERRKPRFIGQ